MGRKNNRKSLGIRTERAKIRKDVLFFYIVSFHYGIVPITWIFEIKELSQLRNKMVL